MYGVLAPFTPEIGARGADAELTQTITDKAVKEVFDRLKDGNKIRVKEQPSRGDHPTHHWYCDIACMDLLDKLNAML